MIDTVIQGGFVVDGTGATRFRADVAIEQNRIVDVGIFEGAEARQTIEASGCVVTPGFIDMHSHADYSLPICPTADSLVHQGITTVVVGQCGASPAPLVDATRELVIEDSSMLDAPLPWDRWSRFGEFLDLLTETGISLNIVPLVGQGTVRAGIMGFGSGAATEDQRNRMAALVEQSLDEGAIGISTGLLYPPGSYAATDELVAVTRPVGKRNGFYFSHIRDEGADLCQAIDEAIRIGRETGASVQISHLKAAGEVNWHVAGRALDLLEKTQSQGLDVTADMYTYPAGSTGMRSLLPEWALDGGVAVTLAHLSDQQTRKKMASEMEVTGFCSLVKFDQVIVASSPRKREIEGLTIGELAESRHLSPYEWIFDTLIETELDVMMVHFMMSEENIQMQLRHPAVMIGTDSFGLSVSGPLSHGKPHPRCYGTYPRLFGRYVREQQILSLEQAVWKTTGFPARKLRWSDRGLLKKGYRADLVVWDPDTIRDTATYQEPHQYPTGISYVFVNGQPVIKEGKHTQQRPGIVLKAG